MADSRQTDFPVEIEGKTYLLRYKFSAAEKTQNVLGKPFNDCVLSLAKGDLQVLKAMFWSALAKHHPDVTLEQAGELLDEGDMHAIGEALGAAVRAGNFTGQEKDAKKKTVNSVPADGLTSEQSVL